MRNAAIALIFAVGLVAGWLLRSSGPDEPAAPGPVVDSPMPVPSVPAEPAPVSDLAELQHIRRLPTDQQPAALRAFLDRRGENYQALMLLAALQLAQESHEAAVASLLRAAMVITDDREQQAFEATLAAVTQAYARRLMALDERVRLDGVYQDITLALPELGSYFLSLGLLRIETGSPEAALVPLAQIENHAEFGARARQLMASIEASANVPLPDLEIVPLQMVNGQFLVQATIDNSRPVLLLLDTGAAMTMLSPRVLRALDYSLTGPSAWFATANGVIEAPIVQLGRLALGDVGLEGLSVGSLVLPEGGSGRIDGLLGMNFLRHFQFRIDQEAGQLLLEYQRQLSR